MKRGILISLLCMAFVISLVACGEEPVKELSKIDLLKAEHFKSIVDLEKTFENVKEINEKTISVFTEELTPSGDEINLVDVKLVKLYSPDEAMKLIALLDKNDAEEEKLIDEQLKTEFGVNSNDLEDDISGDDNYAGMYTRFLDSTFDVYAVRFDCDFSKFNHDKIHVDTPLMDIEVLDASKQSIDVDDDVYLNIQSSEYILDSTDYINKDKIVSFYFFYELPKNYDEDYIIAIGKDSNDFENQEYEYITISK